MKRREDWIESAEAKAQENGGRCLSEFCYVATDRIELECKSGHRWKTQVYNVVNNNRWCRRCSLLLDGLLAAHNIAKSMGGKCLSTTYSGNKEYMEWECKNGHRWASTLGSIKDRKSWCPECYNERRSDKLRLPNGLEIAKQIAKSRGGECLSKKYINSGTKMDWICKKKHKWQARLHHIKDNNSWCPECSYLLAAKKSNYSYIIQHWKTGEELVCVASYEKAVVEYLNLNKINFRWQPKTFKLTLSDGSTTTYRPDIYLYSTKKWIEIKGYFRKDAEEKWNNFILTKPNSELWDKIKLKEMGIL